MKKLLTTICLLMLCVCSIGRTEEKDEYLSFWLSGTDLAYQNTTLNAWLGFRQNMDKEFDIEIGPALGIRTWTEANNPADTQSNLAIGAFAAIHAVDFITIGNPFAEDISWMPKEIAGEPFVSIEYLIDTKGKGTIFSPGGGIRIFDVMAVQYKYRMTHGEPVKDEGLIGISANFRL